MKRHLELRRALYDYMAVDIWLGVANEAEARQENYRRNLSKRGKLFADLSYALRIVSHGGLSFVARQTRSDYMKFQHWDESQEEASASDFPDPYYLEFRLHFRSQFKKDPHGLRSVTKFELGATRAAIESLQYEADRLSDALQLELEHAGPAFSQVARDLATQSKFQALPHIFEALVSDAKQKSKESEMRQRPSKASPPTEADKEVKIFRRSMESADSVGLLRQIALEGLALRVIMEAAILARQDDTNDTLLINRAGQKIFCESDAELLSKVSMEIPRVRKRYALPKWSDTTIEERRVLKDKLFELCQESARFLSNQLGKPGPLHEAEAPDPRVPFDIFQVVVSATSQPQRSFGLGR